MHIFLAVTDDCLYLNQQYEDKKSNERMTMLADRRIEFLINNGVKEVKNTKNQGNKTQ